MVPVDLKSLVARLDGTCRRTLEGAAGLCLSRTHYNVEIEHWLLKLLDEQETDLAAILAYFEVDPARVVEGLNKSLDGFKTGNARQPGLAPDLVHLVRQAWLLASVQFDSAVTRSGHVLAALLSDDTVSRTASSASPEFDKINSQSLLADLARVTAETGEANEAYASRPPGGATTSPGMPGQPGKPSKTPSLDQYTIDLTGRAREGKIDPVLGRDAEIRQIVDILTRRRQNNPILTGEAGVGKTAVVEGFALAIVDGDVPEPLRDVSIRSLDLGLLQAGAGVKGEFENRLKGVIEEVKSSPSPIVLFIDEAHTMIGAGGQAGQGDAANLLKPALARGELRTIAATTWAEYKKYFEKDAALARRFQVVKVEEPNDDAAISMIRGIATMLEKHHHVRILDEAVVDSVKLSRRYITGRQLPDKAVSLIDTASARVAIEQSAVPPEVEDARRRVEQLEVAIRVLEREAKTAAPDESLPDLRSQHETARVELAKLEERWQKECDLVQRIREIRVSLEGGTPDVANEDASGGPPTADSDSVPDKAEAETDAAEPDSDALRAELDGLNGELATLQGDSPLMQVCVDSQVVADVVSSWTGIPVGRMVADEVRTVLELPQRMEERIIGQDYAINAIAESIRTSRAKLSDPRTPIGVFLLAGPSGVGKTETAITLAELLYGGAQNMTTINMSEYKEEHKVSLLMGSPPGYVGYGEGGVLTEAVRRRPYSVVLLDELEKAHEGVQEIFYQVFDKGSLHDGEGRDIDFKNTVVIATSNAGTDLIAKLCADPETAPEPGALAEALHEELLKTFKPAFLGRVNIIPYYPLGDEVMRKIVELKLGKVRRRVVENYKATFEYDPEVVETIRERCTEVESGARNVDHILSHTLLPELSSEFLSKMADGEAVSRVHVGIGEDRRFAYDLT